MTLEEAKKAYRTLAKTMHPDVGGDEEEFKILADEYTAITVQVSTPSYATFEDLMERSRVMADDMAKLLNEIYPRTSITLFYFYNRIDANIYGNVPFKKMLHIDEIMHSFNYSLPTRICFQRGANSKKWYNLFTVGKNVYCNFEQPEYCDMTGAKPVYAGTRYRIDQNRLLTHCQDMRTGKDIYMRRTPKFTLQELLGI